MIQGQHISSRSDDPIKPRETNIKFRRLSDPAFYIVTVLRGLGPELLAGQKIFITPQNAKPCAETETAHFDTSPPACKLLSHSQDSNGNEFHLKSTIVTTVLGQGGSLLCGGHLRRSLGIITEYTSIHNLELRPEDCSLDKRPTDPFCSDSMFV